MIDQNDIQKIKETVSVFFQKATAPTLDIEAVLSLQTDSKAEEKDVVDLNIKLSDPQIFIGEKGQTIFEMQRLLKIILNKKLQKNFYLNLDINDYKSKKAEYLKVMARDLADEVALTKKAKVLMPMIAYERKIIHAELSQRQDITTESQGDGLERHIIINPK